MAPAAPRGTVYLPNPKRSSANALGGCSSFFCTALLLRAWQTELIYTPLRIINSSMQKNELHPVRSERLRFLREKEKRSGGTAFMTLVGNFVRTREQGEKSSSWRSMNGMRSNSRTISFLMRTLILASHASFAPFVPYEWIIFFLSGHLYKISHQSHSSRPPWASMRGKTEATPVLGPRRTR